VATLKFIIDLFGSTILVPVVVFILALFLKVELRKAARAAINMAVGLTAFNAIVSVLLGNLGPVVTEMVEHAGVNLPALDIGWSAAAIIVYSNRMGMLFIPFGLLLNFALFLLKWTDSFQPTDIWNYYHFTFWGIIVELATGSTWLGVAAAIMGMLWSLLFADWLAPSLQTYYGYNGVTLTAYGDNVMTPWAILCKWVLNKLGLLDRIKLDPETLKEKFGFFGDPLMIGLVVGGAVTIVAKYHALGSAETWALVLKTAAITAAVMIIYPSISGLFVRGLTPISQTLNERIRRGEIKRKDFYIGIDPAVFFGEQATLATGLVLIPIFLLCAIFLPGNKVLPLADIAALPFFAAPAIAVMRGNVFGAAITLGIWLIFGLYANSDIAAIFTQAAAAVGAVPADVGSLYVTSIVVGKNPIGWLVYKAFSAPGAIRWVTIALMVGVYLVTYFLFQRNRKAWQMAAGAPEEYFQEQSAGADTL